MNEPRQTEDRRSCRVIYEGRVQGVGFRFTAASAAKSCQVNGYVRNCADGTVELVAEGPSRNVERLLQNLSQTFAGNIAAQTVEEIAQSEPLRWFEIRR
jgi:acylphosphatase